MHLSNALFNAGIFANGDNFIQNGNVTALTSAFICYKNIKFDIFHLSYPYVGELIAISKMFKNVYIDFAWAHAISENASIHALLECFDVLPINKIFAFGGNAGVPMWTYAFLVQAKQNIATALSIAIEKNIFTLNESKWVARRILFDNPNEVYGLGLEFDRLFNESKS